MNVEQLPNFHIDRPKPAIARIEGRIETSFSEIDPSDMQPIPLHNIVWDGVSLTFKKVGDYSVPTGPFGMDIPVELYTGELGYEDIEGEQRKSNLTAITSGPKPVLFAGARNGFYAYDPLAKGKGDPFYVVGIQPAELEEDMKKLAAVYHELGHVLICDTNADLKLLKAALTRQKRHLPKIRKASAYGAELAMTIPNHVRQNPPPVNRNTLFTMDGSSRGAEKAISLFHERNAWAAGMNIVRANNYPTGYENPLSFFDYARLCLSSYGNHYRDQKFVKGWKK